MKAQLFPLQNRGMSRDLSVSKAGNDLAWENHNIRVTPRDHDTLLSVTNERGTKEVFLPEGVIRGMLIGWNVLNNHVILFSTESDGSGAPVVDENGFSVYPQELTYETDGGNQDINVIALDGDSWYIDDTDGSDYNPDSIDSTKCDHIYRIDYDGEYFRMVCGDTDDDGVDADNPVYGQPLFSGNLGFDKRCPIESIVSYEAANIQKIYWLDGKHVLRFMNFVETNANREGWTVDNTYFDSNRVAKTGLNVSITKTNSGNNRANGVAQYLVTYYNKHGQETGYVWVSDLVYLSPIERGGSPDGTNANLIKLEVSGLDTKYTNFKVYSIVRTSLDGEAVAYVIADNAVPADGKAIVIDDGAPLRTTDVTALLFLGGRDVIAGTMTEKDNTLFLGDIASAGFGGYDDIQAAIRRDMFGPDYDAASVSFVLTNASTLDGDEASIPLEPMGGFYAYSNQLNLTSSHIQSFKGGEKYRFAVSFRTASGVSSKAFWIGDKVNNLYPQMVGNAVRRPIAKCTLPATVVDVALSYGYTSATLMIAKADASDRNVIAQGIINPTMFNVWDRYKNRLYSYSSWITRPRHSGFASSHFEPVHNSITRTGEIQCNYWDTKLYVKNGDESSSYDVDDPTPYYRVYKTGGTNQYNTPVSSGDLVDAIAISPYSHYKLVYYIRRGGSFKRQQCCGGWVLILTTGVIPDTEVNGLLQYNGKESYNRTWKLSYNGVTVSIKLVKYMTEQYSKYLDFWSKEIYEPLKEYLDADAIINSRQFEKEFNTLDVEDPAVYAPTKTQKVLFFDNGGNLLPGPDVIDYEDGGFGVAMEELSRDIRFAWKLLYDTSTSASSTNKYRSSYSKRNLFFVDENIVTVNSPEFEQEQVSADKLDGVNLRIVGIAKISNNITDYTVETGTSKKAGENVIQENFSTDMPATNPDGLIDAPLYAERGLTPLDTLPSVKDGDEIKLLEPSVNSSDYLWSNSSVWYWLYMWHKSGGIPGVGAGDGFKDNSSSISTDDEEEFEISGGGTISQTLYSELISKNFSNLRFAYNTIYTDGIVDYHPEDIRSYTYTDNQYVSLKVNGKQRSYNANIRAGINMPTDKKYPVCYTEAGNPDDENVKWFLGSDDQVLMQYKSTAHVVVSLGMYGDSYRILPKIRYSDVNFIDTYINPIDGEGSPSMTGGLLSWVGNSDTDDISHPFSAYQDALTLPVGTISANDRYVFIGELYRTGDNVLYGGTSEAAIESNIFITAGPQATLLGGQQMTLIGNQGDTYFQRWDCLKTKPYDTTQGNSVTDITSVMLETHVNIDGRYDNLRNQKLLSSIDTTNYGQVNPVYSQANNFFANNDIVDDHTVDAYRSSITWTLEKAPSADIDAWSHITLASTLNLDGDKGVCRALRRFQNSILAFQDRGIAEVLFNSRTQIATTEGVPIEIANSGKVDGKRYISNKYGCINKWSITEGKNGLYFIDNTNKMIGMFNGQNLSSLTSAAYLDIWMREHNSLDIWNPVDNGNFISFYDRVHSDVYFVGNDPKNPTIVFNEVLGNFTGFFDYSDVPMMANVGDRFISFHKNLAGGNSLWLQNEGLYNHFYGITKPFYMIWRVQPDPYGDKIWGSLEYRADFFKVLVSMGDLNIGEASPTGGQQMSGDAIIEGDYIPDMTFSDVEVWNEYQSTGNIKMEWKGKESAESYPDIRKKFRIWRADIPRAQKNETNRYGLDRIRNPWVWFKIGMSYDKVDNTCMMQLHDINVKYYTNE